MRLFILLGLLVSIVSCGTRPSGEPNSNSSQNRDPREILNGAAISASETPQVGALVISAPNGSVCTGALISPNQFLTAAHCIFDTQGKLLPNNRFSVAFTDRAGTGTRISVLDARVHDRYSPLVSFGSRGDIAVLTLAQNVSLSSYLALDETTAFANPGQALNIIGYGRANNSSASVGIKRKGTFRFSSYNEAGTHFFDAVAGAELQNTCGGDSGGPVLFQGKIVGIVHGGSIVCEEGKFSPSYLTSTKSYLNWIKTGKDTPSAGSLWQNQISRFDVNKDGQVGPLDVLRIINLVNRLGTGVLTIATYGSPGDIGYVDVDGDGVLTPLDVLVLINSINTGGSRPVGPAGTTVASAQINMDDVNRAGQGNYTTVDRKFDNFVIGFYLMNRFTSFYGFTNWGGRNEKWFYSSASAGYFILPNGEVYRSDARRDAQGRVTGQFVAELQPRHYANPGLITNPSR